MRDETQRLYIQRGVINDNATSTDKLKASKRARKAMQEAGLSVDTYPVLRDFLGYLARAPDVLSFVGLDAEEGRLARLRSDRYGWRWREVCKLLPEFKTKGCTDDDLRRATLRACGGRWQYIAPALSWEEYWQFTPVENWAEEYRIAGKYLLAYTIAEKQWQ